VASSQTRSKPPAQTTTSAPADPLSTALADPPPLVAQVAADPPAPVVPAVTAAGRPAPLGTALTPQPSGRLPLQPALLEALTAPLGFVPGPSIVPANPPPPPVAASNTTAVTGVGVPLAGADQGPTFAADPAAPSIIVGQHRIAHTAQRRMFDSPMEFLREHLLPAAPSPFGLPRPFELRAQHSWPFARTLSQELADGLADNSVGITAMVMAALVAMTVLTAAGAGLSGRPLRHTAWRTGRRRFRAVSDWVTVLPEADAVPEGAPRRLTSEPRVTTWPARPLVVEPLAALRERRVA
jgi:hypothetical protein